LQYKVIESQYSVHTYVNDWVKQGYKVKQMAGGDQAFHILMEKAEDGYIPNPTYISKETNSVTEAETFINQKIEEGYAVEAVCYGGTRIYILMYQNAPKDYKLYMASNWSNLQDFANEKAEEGYKVEKIDAGSYDSSFVAMTKNK